MHIHLPTPVALALLALVAQPQEALPERAEGEPWILELEESDPLLPGRGAMRRVSWRTAGMSRLYISAVSEDLDPYLRVEAADGALLGQDEDGGGADAAFLELWLADPTELAITAAAESPGQLGAVRLLLVEAAETEASLAAEREAVAGLEEVRGLRAARDWEGARRRVRELAAAIQQVEGWSDSPGLVRALHFLGVQAQELGDLECGAETFEAVRAFRERTLPRDHPGLQAARLNAAAILFSRGEFARARPLFEGVVEVFQRTLPADHQHLMIARSNLALARLALGDAAGARPLLENVVESLSRTRPTEDPTLQSARLNLAATLGVLLEFEACRRLQEEILEIWTRTLPEDHIDLARGRGSLASTLESLGEREAAVELREEALAALANRLPAGHPELVGFQIAQGDALLDLGKIEQGRAILEEANRVIERTLPPDNPRAIYVRRRLYWLHLCGGNEPEAVAMAAELASTCLGSLRSAALALAPREAEALAGEVVQEELGLLVSVVLGAGSIDPQPQLAPEAFALAEACRGVAAVGWRAVRWARGAADGERLRELGAAIEAERRRITLLTVGGADRGALLDAIGRRDRAEQRLLEYLLELGAGEQVLPRVDARSIAASLAEDEAAVGYLRYVRHTVTEPGRVHFEGVDHLAAFVVRPGGSLDLVDLGPVKAVHAAAMGWRDAVVAEARLAGAGDPRGIGGVAPAGRPPDPARAGEALRELVLDPLLPHLGDARRAVVALDDALHLIPLDALPQRGGRVGDHLTLVVRTTLSELARPGGKAPLHPESLLAVGGIDYDRRDPDGAGASSLPVAEGTPADLRARAEPSEFAPLPHTRREVEGIRELFRSSPGGETAWAELLTAGAATRGNLQRLAPRARYLHLATHGWFAPGSVGARAREEVLDQRLGLPRATTWEKDVRQFAPMVLCGLALSGANRAEEGAGPLAGALTGEELAAMDLSGCELAVLSACETRLGVPRAGQGVASLQRALHAAGVRSAVTSLWPVRDEAARELMLAFYRALWVEGRSKAEALWSAKRALRERVDSSGRPVYSTFDWAGWVLTGEP